MVSLLTHLVVLAVIIGFLHLWHRTSPAEGSGWALFAAVVIALTVRSHNPNAGLVFYGALAAAFGYTWHIAREKADSGWVLVGCILAAVSTISLLT
ncbi:MAG: hypothetical protein K2W82_17325 [Candidatus Obscuribacterales bacterium]|nr:hypothetical protein [Candidatus Obscuribacterales bacterium]